MNQHQVNQAEVRFQLGEEIGQQGKNSRVFRARDLNLDAEIVIKKIEKARLDKDQFFKESQLLHLSSHPNVVPIRYACEDAESVFLALPFYPNGSLKKRMDEQFLTLREIIRFSINFLSGLQNIHSKRLIHFDIKPDNILIAANGEAHLADFGLCKAMDYRLSADQDGFYLKQLPPESFGNTSNGFTARFDIY